MKRKKAFTSGYVFALFVASALLPLLIADDAYGASTISGTVNENGTLNLAAPQGYKIGGIQFASYGTPVDYQIGSCHASNSVAKVEAAINNNSLSIAATNDVFGDPCAGTGKRLSVVLLIEPQVVQRSLAAPSNLQGQIDSTTVTVTWDAPVQGNTPVERYAIFWSYNNWAGGWAIASTTLNATINNIPFGQQVQIKVRADNDSLAVYSGWSNEISLQAVATPEPSSSPSPAPVEPTPEPSPTSEPSPSPTLVEPSPSPSPTVEPSPSPEPSTSPTSEPEPSASPEPTSSPSPSAEPSPSPSPSAEPVATPTSTPEPSPEPAPSPQPQPSPSPAPSPEPAPEPTPVVAPQPPAVQPDPVVIPDPPAEEEEPPPPAEEPPTKPEVVQPPEEEPLPPAVEPEPPVVEEEPPAVEEEPPAIEEEPPAIEPEPPVVEEEPPAIEAEPEPLPNDDKPLPNDEPLTAETWQPEVAPEEYLDEEEIKTYEEIGLVPNSPDQLPTDVPKLPEPEALKPHIQQDVAGVENGGIAFFGTQSQPQVIGEDGQLTPPPPPPGSGLPIPPDAVTTTETFIGQAGGVTFNSPDIAVPVEPIELDIEIPGVGEAAQALANTYVAMANIGNDMSPTTRKKAKKILLATIVVGQIVSMRRM